jgi:hypothetical protein
MGREVKRVALDFDWPLNKAWSGYLSPEWRSCPSSTCRGGETVDAAWLAAIVHLLLIAGENGLKGKGKLHPWLESLDNAPTDPDNGYAVVPPTPLLSDLTTKLAGRVPGFLGHDAIDRWAATKAIVRGAGLPENWGTCKMCEGHGVHPDDRAASEAWERTEPPAGEGWQIWETVSEGSPITPVFATAGELAEWCVLNKPWGTDMNYPAWRRFIEVGWAPSSIGTEQGVIDGVVAVGKGME